MSLPGQPSLQISQPAKPVSGLAIVCLLFGISAWIFWPILGGILALIAGFMAKNEITKSKGQLAGGGMATAGMVLGYINVAISFFLCILVTLPIALGAIFMYLSRLFNTMP